MRDPEARLEFARRFFQAPNVLTWNRIASGGLDPGTMERLRPWLDRLMAGKEPTILPCPDGHGVSWYVATSDGLEFRHVRSALVAWLGCTYSDFRGQPTPLDPNNPVEAALADEFGRSVCRVDITSEFIESARSRLEQFATLLDEAPERLGRAPRPVGRVLSDFEEAIRRNDAAAVADCLRELEQGGHLDAQNLMYLRMRRDGMCGHWKAVLDTCHQRQVLSASRRPRRVAQAILRAAYATTLAAFQATRDAQGALQRFRSDVYPTYGPLFTTRTIYQCPEADALFVMRSLCEGELATAREIVAGVGEEAPHRPWLLALVKAAPPGLGGGIEPEGTADLLNAAVTARTQGHLDRAWEFAQRLEVTSATIRCVLQCAFEIGTLSAAKEALAAFSRLPAITREGCQQQDPGLKSYLAGLSRLTPLSSSAAADGPISSRVPQSWSEWVEAISSNPGWGEAAAVCERGAMDWDVSEFEHGESIRRFTLVLNALSPQSQPRLLESLPHLLQSLARIDTLPKSLGDALEALTLLLLTDEASGKSFFGTLADLVNLTLSVGVNQKGYRELLSDCIGRVNERAGAADCDKLLELLDVFVTHASPEPASRGALAGAIGEVFVRSRRKVKVYQVTVLGQLLEDIGSELPEPLRRRGGGESSGPESDPLAALAGRSIALYSLRENVLRRVSALLIDASVGARVTTFHDKVGGDDGLRRAARTADIFVIATAAAKHAATDFIEAERGSSGVTLRPAGQGSASMMRALYEFAEQLAMEGVAA